MTEMIETKEASTSVPSLSTLSAAETNSIRVAVIGNVDSGKSTLVGVLTRNTLDDGRGKARSFVFHTKHEMETGRSSTVTVEVMGFEGEKPIGVDLKTTRQRMWQNVHEHADRSVTFVDLCGHEKYLKTTIFGLTGLLPDFGMVIVGANMGVSKMTKEHIGIAAALGLPIFIVVTKIDIAPLPVLQNTMDTINKVLRQARRVPYVMKTHEHVETACKSILSDRITPIVCVSSVSGDGLDLLRSLLRLLPPRISSLAVRGEAFTLKGDVGGGLDITGKDKTAVTAAETHPETPAAGAGVVPMEAGISTAGEATIDSVFNVPGVGTVVAGTVMKGSIRVGSTMLLGPDRLGEFQPVSVRSIHVQYVEVDVAYPGGSAAFAIRAKGKLKGGVTGKRSWVRKGMSLVDPSLRPIAHWEFCAEILVLHHQTTMAVGYAPIMHCGVVTQSAKVTEINGMDGLPMPALRTGDRAVITCRFMYRPEYIRVGDMLLFREGRAKGVGRVRSLACPNHSGLTET